MVLERRYEVFAIILKEQMQKFNNSSVVQTPD